MSGSNVLIQGDIGVGKTRSLITLLPEYTDEHGEVRRGAGQHVRLCSLEPGAEATLGANLCRSPTDFGIHVRYIQPIALDWPDFRKFVQVLNTMPTDKAIEIQDPNRRKCTQLLELIDTLNNFTCDRCGGTFGDAAEWGDDVSLAIDGLTGLTTIARHLCVGLKPILSKVDYQPIMGAVESFLQLFWGATKCNAILLSHVDREVSPISGMTSITVHTLGQKLAPRIVKMPDEVITATFDEGRFAWNTELPGQVVKCRALPRGLNLDADFTTLIK